MTFLPEFHQAVEFLSSLRRGDMLRVTKDGRTSEMSVTRPAHRSDGPHGDWESIAVTVSYGPGRYAFDVTAEAMAPRRPGLVVSPITVELVRRAEVAS